jgi:hypothetical protein
MKVSIINEKREFVEFEIPSLENLKEWEKRITIILKTLNRKNKIKKLLEIK